MKKNFKIYLTLLCILPFGVMADENEPTVQDVYAPITTGASFLTIAPDARCGGMGDTGGATTPDENSQFWNPAKYAFIDGVGGASVSYVPWLRKLVSDIDLVSAAGFYKIKDVQTVAMSFRFFSIGNVLIKKDPNDPGYNVKPYDLALDASYSRILAKGFSMGVALRFIWSDLTGGHSVDGNYLKPGWSIAADISGFYTKEVDFSFGKGSGSFGFNISNLGKKIDYGDYRSSAFIPTNLRLGGSFKLPLGNDYNHMSFNVDINKLLVPARPIQGDKESLEDYNKRLDEYYHMDPLTGIGKSFADMPDGSKYDFVYKLKQMNFSVGIEYDYKNMFLARMGYFNESKQCGNRKFLEFGAGFRLNVVVLDVAYLLSVAKNNPLDQTLKFTLGFNMAGIHNLVKNDVNDNENEVF
ncbi:MAG: type IX secretion system outer membrane channel protein PorV [Paludibacteraceae bacterium]|nr:type IX secretion system outer membrane channel protein PorV [Paludibacteraceae bacterium]